MYISGLGKNKIDEIAQVLDNNDISFEVWDEKIIIEDDEEQLFTLFVSDTKYIRLFLGFCFETVAIVYEGQTLAQIDINKNEYYQIVW